MAETNCKAWLNEVEWDMIQEDAVTRYLEWGNNNYRDDLRRPVTLSDEYSIYFVVDTWGPEPKAVLMKMNKWGSESLCEKKIPAEFIPGFLAARGKVRGILEPTEEIKEWLRRTIEKEEC